MENPCMLVCMSPDANLLNPQNRRYVVLVLFCFLQRFFLYTWDMTSLFYGVALSFLLKKQQFLPQKEKKKERVHLYRRSTC